MVEQLTLAGLRVPQRLVPRVHLQVVLGEETSQRGLAIELADMNGDEPADFGIQVPVLKIRQKHRQTVPKGGALPPSARKPFRTSSTPW